MKDTRFKCKLLALILTGLSACLNSSQLYITVNEHPMNQSLTELIEDSWPPITKPCVTGCHFWLTRQIADVLISPSGCPIVHGMHAEHRLKAYEAGWKYEGNQQPEGLERHFCCPWRNQTLFPPLLMK